MFVWNGISGDSVLAYACYHDYVSNYSDSDIITALDRNHQEGYDTNVTVAAGMFGSGDHGGGRLEVRNTYCYRFAGRRTR